MRRLAALALLLAPLAGCRTAAPAPGAPGPAGVAAQQARWTSARVASYTFTYERQCFCTAETSGPFVVTVENGRVTSVRRLAGGLTPEGQPLPGAEDTRATNRLRVEDFFALVRGAYDEGAATVRATYDDRLGYPTSIWIDRDTRLADEEIGYRITALRRL